MLNRCQYLRAKLVQLLFINQELETRLAAQHQHLLRASTDRILQASQLSSQIVKAKVKAISAIISQTLDQILQLQPSALQAHPAVARLQDKVQQVLVFLREYQSRVYLGQGIFVDLQQFNDLLARLQKLILPLLSRHRNYLTQLYQRMQKEDLLRQDIANLEQVLAQVESARVAHEFQILRGQAQTRKGQNKEQADRLKQDLFNVL